MILRFELESKQKCAICAICAIALSWPAVDGNPLFDSARPWYGETGGRMAVKKDSAEAIVRTVRRVTE